MDYVELLAKSLYEQQNEMKWAEVEKDHPWNPSMRSAWMEWARGECEKHLDLSYVLPRRLQDVQQGLNETANQPSLAERVNMIERYLWGRP